MKIDGEYILGDCPDSVNFSGKEIFKNIHFVEEMGSSLVFEYGSQHSKMLTCSLKLKRYYLNDYEDEYYSKNPALLCDTNNVDKIINNIAENPGLFMYNNRLKNRCFTFLVDTLVSGSVVDTGEVYLNTLNELCKASDGYLSEYINFIIPELVEGNFKKLIRYIKVLPQKGDNDLEHFFIHHYIYSVAVYKDMSQKRLDKFFKDKLESNELSEDEKIYVGELKKKIDDGISQY